MKVVFLGTAINQLAIEEELHEISQRFHVVSLIGENVSLQDISSFTSNTKANILHIADHCDKQGIHLANGEILTKERLAHIARQMRVDAVFLNACDSAYLAQYLVDNNVPVVLAYTLDIFDGDAFRIASFFYQELKDHNNDLKEAYEHASPRDGTFAWFSNGLHTQTLLKPLLSELTTLRQFVDKMTKTMEGLKEEFVTKEKRFLTILAAFVVFLLLLNAILWSVFVSSDYVSASALNDIDNIELNQTIPPTDDKWMVICHVPSNKTMRINRVAWKGHQGHGDYEGECRELPTVTNTVVPVLTSTWTPLPNSTSTNTVIPTETNTVIPTNTKTPTEIVPTVTETHKPKDTATAIIIPTWTTTATKTNTFLPTRTSTRFIPIATIKPTVTEPFVPTIPFIPTATNIVIPTETIIPTNTSMGTKTKIPIPTSTFTKVVTPTPTWTRLPINPC